jgi:hypothetical protein
MQVLLSFLRQFAENLALDDSQHSSNRFLTALETSLPMLTNR